LQTGQNLQVAGFIIHFDLPQAQDGIQQRRGRARRVGSKFKKIKEYFLITKESPETAKFDRLKIQSHMSNSIFQTDEEQSKTLRKKSN
jgi:superfamily II DNA/RNA helicase